MVSEQFSKLESSCIRLGLQLMGLSQMYYGIRILWTNQSAKKYTDKQRNWKRGIRRLDSHPTQYSRMDTMDSTICVLNSRLIPATSTDNGHYGKGSGIFPYQNYCSLHCSIYVKTATNWSCKMLLMYLSLTEIIFRASIKVEEAKIWCIVRLSIIHICLQE